MVLNSPGMARTVAGEIGGAALVELPRHEQRALVAAERRVLLHRGGQRVSRQQRGVESEVRQRLVRVDRQDARQHPAAREVAGLVGDGPAQRVAAHGEEQVAKHGVEQREAELQPPHGRRLGGERVEARRRERLREVIK